MDRARPVTTGWPTRPRRPLRERLQLAQQPARLRRHRPGPARQRQLPRYADLPARAVVWNVVATPRAVAELKHLVLPGDGLRRLPRLLRPEAGRRWRKAAGRGLEVSVYGVPAYSTLGWSNWLGGDPLLNTFRARPEASWRG
jgi:predicted aminopeptidase